MKPSTTDDELVKFSDMPKGITPDQMEGFRMAAIIANDRFKAATDEAVQADRKNILGLVGELSRRYARFGDNHIVYHREEAVIPVSEVLKLHAQLNDMLVTSRKRAQGQSDASKGLVKWGS